MIYQKSKNKTGFENIIVLISKALWNLINFLFKKKKSGKVVEQWKEVQELMVKDDPHAWAMAVMKADSILDSVLQKREETRLGEPSRGSTMGERLKNMKNKLDREILQSAWDAHKVRNQIAHGDSGITRVQAQQAIADFRKVLNCLNEL